MKTFNVIEDRGHGIRYVMFSGSYNDCCTWIKTNCREHCLNAAMLVSNDDNDVNGNGDYFTYTIEEDEED